MPTPDAGDLAADRLPAELVAELRRLGDEVADLRRAVEALRPAPDRRAELLSHALAEHFGEGEEVTVSKLLAIVTDDPHCRLAVALAQAIDLEADGAAARLGLLLARLPCLELMPYRRRGAAVYRLREDCEG